MTGKYRLYHSLRSAGKTALEAYAEYKARQSMLEDMGLSARLIDSLIGSVVLAAVDSILDKWFFWERRNIWIVSPSGRSVVSLPLGLALQVIRKHDWDFAEVEPVKSSGNVSINV